MSVNPGDDTTVEATYVNDGNADWNVYASAVGSKAGSWVSVDGPSSGLLPYDDGNGERSFDFIISPDDSVTAGSETVVSIVGKEGAAPSSAKKTFVSSWVSQEAPASPRQFIVVQH